ncbi:MAG: bacillithiol biosynthesis cysteine-adding enzyme BshC [Candidatus Palauibacterales bacterium]|nr:bacillithiol biosynthesis cysteine-adding enzyme BshC [Candidatus Palauibacterales bacterium]
MIGLRLEPERLTGTEGLASDLLDGDPRAVSLFPPAVFDPSGEPGLPDRQGGVRLDADAFHCLSSGAERLDRVLAGEGFAVTTGQQPVLFGGPLYVLYKALSAVRFAARLEQRLGLPCLPVFWVASDDHDWREVASVGYLDRDESLRRLEIPPPSGAEDRSVGPTQLPEDIAHRARELIAALETREEAGQWVNGLYQEYSPGRSFTEAFIGWVSRWLADLPIAFLDASHPAVREAAVPFVQRVLADWRDVDAALREGSDSVVQRGYEPQLSYMEDAIPVFRDSGDSRFRLRGTTAGIRVDSRGSTFDLDHLMDEVESSPGMFSPSAALRPVLESWLLPVAATVLGPGELAYWAQLGPLFSLLDVPMPGIVPRGAWRVVEPKIERLLTKTGASPDDLRDGGTSAATELVARNRPDALEDALQSLEKAVEAEFDAVDRALSEEMPGLRSAAGKARSQVQSATAALRKKADSMTRDRETTAIGQLHRAADNLFPGGVAQERAVASLMYLVRYGDEFLEVVRERALGEPPASPAGVSHGVAGGTPAE